MASLAADEFGKLKLSLVTELPPTDNHIYFNLPGGGRALTKKAKQFKARVKEQTALTAVRNTLPFREHIPYKATITLYVKLYTKGWPKTAKWKYRKMDATNRTKLILDAITEAVGVDDRHITEVELAKREEANPDNVRVEIALEELWPR